MRTYSDSYILYSDRRSTNIKYLSLNNKLGFPSSFMHFYERISWKIWILRDSPVTFVLLRLLFRLTEVILRRNRCSFSGKCNYWKVVTTLCYVLFARVQLSLVEEPFLDFKCYTTKCIRALNSIQLMLTLSEYVIFEKYFWKHTTYLYFVLCNGPNSGKFKWIFEISRATLCSRYFYLACRGVEVCTG